MSKYLSKSLYFFVLFRNQNEWMRIFSKMIPYYYNEHFIMRNHYKRFFWVRSRCIELQLKHIFTHHKYEVYAVHYLQKWAKWYIAYGTSEWIEHILYSISKLWIFSTMKLSMVISTTTAITINKIKSKHSRHFLWRKWSKLST